MDVNIGKKASYARILLGAVSTLLGIAGYAGIVKVAFILPQALTSVVLVVIGVILLTKGVTKKCAVYKLLSLNTD